MAVAVSVLKRIINELVRWLDESGADEIVKWSHTLLAHAVGPNSPDRRAIAAAAPTADKITGGRTVAEVRCKDPNRAFDFFSHVPEATHMLTQLYTDIVGMPASYRTMDGHGVHAFRLVNAGGDVVFVKFHWKSQQGVKGMTLEQQKAAYGDDPFRNGFAPNRKAMDDFLRYAHEQNYTRRRLTPEELFAPETLETFKI